MKHKITSMLLLFSLIVISITYDFFRFDNIFCVGGTVIAVYMRKLHSFPIRGIYSNEGGDRDDG